MCRNILLYRVLGIQHYNSPKFVVDIFSREACDKLCSISLQNQWKKTTILATAPICVARTWLGEKSLCLFLGQKFRFLAKKSEFCHTTPILVQDPFLALGMTVNFPPWKPFFDFPFRSYSCYRKKNLADGSKSLPPSHCRSSVCQ